MHSAIHPEGILPVSGPRIEKRCRDGWSDSCVHQLFEARVELCPDAIAVVEGSRQWTYGELNAHANRIARALQARGARPGVPVGVCMPRGLELAAALLGVLKAGSACLPLDPDYPAGRLEFMQADAQAPLVLAAPGMESRLASSARSRILPVGPECAEFRSESDQNLPSPASQEDVAYVIYTSGSTGSPRGVELPHRGLANHHRAALELYGIGPGDRVLQSASISFDISVEEMFPAWAGGAAVVFRTPAVSLLPERFLAWVREQGITVLDLPTAYWHELVHGLAGTRTALPPALRLVVVGGEKASAPAYAAWKQLTGDRVRWINTYGPTEASVIATAYEPLDRDPEDVSDLPIGKPIANTSIYILDAGLCPVAPGETGQIYIAGAGLARGYLNRPELTSQKFVKDPFDAEPGARMYATGDLGRVLPDGEIEFRGRSDFQVKIRGFRVEPGEVEAVLAEHPGIKDAWVVVQEGHSGEKRLGAFYVPGGQSAPAASELREFLRDRLPEYMIPFGFAPLSAAPLTPNGKVDRQALAALPVAPTAGDEDFCAPRDAREAAMAKVWETVLGVRPISVRASFFDLGGHSLMALRLMHALEREFGRELPLAALFHAPTIEKLTAELNSDQVFDSPVSLVPIQPRGVKPALFCVHGLGGHVLRFSALAARLGPDQPFYGLQARGLDARSQCETTVEGMARHYLEDVRTLQPAGPYYLCGYSFGGAVAFEMARQLRAAGESVAFTGLIDAYPGAARERGSLATAFLSLPPREKVRYLLAKPAVLLKRLRSRLEARSFPAALRNVHAACAVAERSYAWRPYEGEVWLFRASDKGLRGLEPPPAGMASWHIRELAGNHGSILREPGVAVLADALKAALDEGRGTVQEASWLR